MAVAEDDWEQHWGHYAESAERNPAQLYRRRLIFRRLLRVARLGLIRFNAPDRIFESEPLAGDLRLVERRLNAAQLRDQGAAGALIKQPAVLAGIALKTANGAIDQRIIVSQFTSRVFSSQLSNGFFIRIVSSRSGLVESKATGQPTNSSMRRTYLMACAGSSAQLRAFAVGSCQPSMTS